MDHITNEYFLPASAALKERLKIFTAEMATAGSTLSKHIYEAALAVELQTEIRGRI
jgi:hypothetical protein